MIKEILKHKNIGTPNYLVELSRLVNNGDYVDADISDFFDNKLIDDKTVFDGGLTVLLSIGFISISDKDVLSVPEKHQHFLRNDKLLTGKIVEMFIDNWHEDESFKLIFNRETVYHDLEISVVINNAGFGFRYAKLKQFLIDFGVIGTHPYLNDCYLVTNMYKKFFDKNIVIRVKQQSLTLEEFNRIQSLKNTLGEEAEAFVVKYEKEIFNNHILVSAIEQISHIDVSAGYDVVSLINSNSVRIDKYIEVKSYSNTISFYWSVNEVEVSRIEKDNYYLYLIDRELMNESGYVPIMIKNPYDNVFSSNAWDGKCMKWKFKEH